MGRFNRFAAGACALAWSFAAAPALAADPAPAPAPAAIPATAPATTSAQLQIKDFLADPTLSLVRLSPSGRYLAFVRTENGVDLVAVHDRTTGQTYSIMRGNPADKQSAKLEIRQRVVYLSWKTEDRLLVSVSPPTKVDGFGLYPLPVHYLIGRDGSGIVAINQKVKGKNATVELSDVLDPLREDPNHVMAAFRRLGDGAITVDRIDVRDGAREVLERGSSDVDTYGVDRHGNIVTRTVSYGTTVKIEGRAPGETKWRKLVELHRKELRALDEFEILGFAETPGTLYVQAGPADASDGDTLQVRTYDLKTGRLGPRVWSHPKYDVDDIVQSDSGALLAGCYWTDIYVCDFKDPKLAAHLKGIARYFENVRSVAVVSQSQDEQVWVLAVSGPQERTSYYLYDAKVHDVEPIGESWPELTRERLGERRRFDYRARDGFALSAYVTAPSGPAARRPLVVMPHGGPEMRDNLEFDAWAHYLAGRGYVVLQPNFRGSGGFGRAFAEAGYRQWGGRMQDDVTDAVKALIAAGDADPARVCIVGASYGGYAALYGPLGEPGLYRCAVSVEGVTDLTEFVKWEKNRRGSDSSAYAYWIKAIGDPAVDAARLAAKSPAQHAGEIGVPVLLIHGDADDTVPVDQSRRMKKALEKAGKQVRYVEIKDMDHNDWLSRDETTVLTEVESFLAQHLGTAAPAATTAAAPAASAPAAAGGE